MNNIKCYALFLILTVLAPRAVAEFAIEWSFTVNEALFGLPGASDHKYDVYAAPGGDLLVVSSAWFYADTTLFGKPSKTSSIVVLDSKGKVLAKHSARPSATEEQARYMLPRYTPVFCQKGKLVTLRVDGFASSKRHWLVWTFRDDGSITEEPFPFSGHLSGGNLTPLSSGLIEKEGASSSIFSLQRAGTSVTIRRIALQN